MTDHLNPDYEPRHAESSTASLLTELQLYGHRPFQDELDARPLPEEYAIRGALADIFDALVSTLTDTRLEPDLEDLLWSTVNLFHRAADRIERELDTNEHSQRRSQKDQDGSETRSVELERLLAEGLTLIERRNAFEIMRDQAADLFETHTGTGWRPRTGSKVNHRALTSAVIDSRDFLAAKRRAETEVMVPPGPKVAFTGGYECNDHEAIWAALDRVHAKHPGMVLLQGGIAQGRRAHRRLLGRQPQCAAGRLQAQLHPTQERRPIQAQRPTARRAADRRRGVPRLGHFRQPGRQGPQARYPVARLPQGRRGVSPGRTAANPEIRKGGSERSRCCAHHVLLTEQRHLRHCGGTRRTKYGKLVEQEDGTMVFGVVFSLLGIGMLVALMFNMAILALPLFVGVAAGRFAYDTGAGALGAIVVGFAAGAAALGVGQFMLVMTRSSIVRLAIALTFTAPAAFAGYHLVLGLSHIGGAHEVWQQVFASIGAVSIGVAATMRLATPIISPTQITHTV